MTLGVVSFGPASRVLPNPCRCAFHRQQAAAQLGALGFVPLAFLVAGSAATAGAAIGAWLSSADSWSSGDYNDYMLRMDQTIHQWDKLGWDSGCWQKNPVMRKNWLDFWARFAAHNKVFGKIPVCRPDETFCFSIVTDSQRGPAQRLMRDLADWGAWLSKTCGAKTDGGPSPMPKPDDGSGGGGGGGAAKPTDWGSVAKWSAIGVGGIVLLSLVGTVRSAFGR